MKIVGILYHPMIETARSLAEKLQHFLHSKGASAWLCSAWEIDKAKAQLDETNLLLSIGGDGTILRAAQAVVPHPVPITGINMGKLGFMTELGVDEALAKLPALLAGEGWIDERALLEAELSASDGKPPSLFYALNDVVLARGPVVRLLNIGVSIDGEALTTYKADGVIAATATGSTGYALAAGGPILHPQAKEYLMLPIVPHLCSHYALVLPSTSVVRLQVSTVHQALLSIDGHTNLTLTDGAVVTVKSSSNTARFLRIHPRSSFYNTLEQSLRGKH
ncbi:NAD(+)/NADH kinase [Chloroflexota bacterium]